MPPGPGPQTDDNTLINWICVTDPADQRMYVELATDLKREHKALDSRVNHMCKLGHAAYNEQVAEFVRQNPLWKQLNKAAGASSGAQAGDAPRVAGSVRVECAPPPPARPRSFPNEEQVDALAKARDATANVHIAGAAGTGKTAVIRAIAAEATQAGRRVDVITPTGVAAANVDGTQQRCAARPIPAAGAASPPAALTLAASHTRASTPLRVRRAQARRCTRLPGSARALSAQPTSGRSCSTTGARSRGGARRK